MRNRMMVYVFYAFFGSGLSATCTFGDGLCIWAHVQFDDFNWTRISGNTPSSYTGPENGLMTENDTYGYYVYIDASKQNKGDKAILRHTWLSSPGRACLSFWYNMYGRDMGDLSVNVRRKNKTLLPVWSKTGNQGEMWIFSAVDLEVGPEVSIEFEATRGSGSTSDIALDDVSLTSRSCFDCTFDGETCLWSVDENLKLSLDEAKRESSTEVISTTGKSKGSTVKTELSAVGVIVGSAVGAVVFVVVLSVVAVCLYSKRRLRDKKDKHIGLHAISDDSTRIEGNRGDHSHEESTINPGYTPSVDIYHPDNNMVGNVNVASDNTEYASVCKTTKHAHGIDDMYNDTCEEKRLRFDSTYDHVTANFSFEYDKTYSTTKSKSNVCGTYDHVTISSDDAYDKTYVRTGAKSSSDKTYDHVTSVTSETSITTSDISTNPDDTYEHLKT